jgi:hypothetical protein
MVDGLKRKRFRSHVSPRFALTDQAAVYARQSELRKKVHSRHRKQCPAGVLTSRKLVVSSITPFISAQISHI